MAAARAQNVRLGLLNTAILIISSITMVYAWVAVKERKFNTFRMYLGITILCGIAFLGVKAYEYYTKYEHWGFMIKEDKFAQYEDDLEEDGCGVCVYSVPSMFEAVSGDREWDKESDTTYVFTPIKAFHPVGYKSPSTAPRPRRKAIRKRPSRWPRTTSSGPEITCRRTAPTSRFTSLVTGLHALHIIGGVIVMLYFLTIGTGLYKRSPEQLSNRIEVTGIFWHFVDLVWITVFPILYLT